MTTPPGACTGLAALLHTGAVAFSVVRYAGVAHLLLLARRTWRDRTPLEVDATVAPPSGARVVGRRCPSAEPLHRPFTRPSPTSTALVPPPVARRGR